MRPGGWHAASRTIGLAVHYRARRHLKSSVCSLNQIASGAYLESDKRHDKANKIVELCKSVAGMSHRGCAEKTYVMEGVGDKCKRACIEADCDRH